MINKTIRSKNALFIIACLLGHNIQSQTPYNPALTNFTGNYTSGTVNDYSYQAILNTVNVSGTANYDISATEYIGILPGSSAANFSSGSFAANIGSQLPLASFHTNGFTGIPQYDRFEVGIILPVTIQQQVDNFLATGSGISPYDPSSMKVKCTYVNTGSNHSFERYGFYYANYSVTNNVWQETPTNYKFRVRFAPPETGNYNCKIELYFNNASIPSQYTSKFIFNASSSTNKGHLTVAGWQYGKLQYADGTKFFAIGENIACAQPVASNPNFLSFLPTDYGAFNMSTPITHQDQRNYISDLALNGGNFVRIRLDNWSVPIVSRDKPRYINYVSKSQQRCLRDYHHNQMFMWEMDKTLGLCEQEKMKIMLNLFGDYDYSTFGGYTSKNMWNENPFSSIFTEDFTNGTPSMAKDEGIMHFFGMSGTSPNATQQLADAKQYVKNMLYYIQARWGYSTSIAMWEMMNETENLGNNGPSGTTSIYNTVSAFKNYVKDWQCEKSYYIGNLYPQHIGTTGTVDGSPQGYNELPNQCLNVFSGNSYQTDYNASVHKYESFDWHRWEHAKNNYDATRPFIFGEIGLSDNVNILERYGDISFHNSVWNSIFSGSIGTALNWQDWEEPFVNHRKNFKAVRDFVNLMDFNQPMAPGSSFVNGLPPWFVYEANVLTYWLKPISNNDIVYGWTRNTTANWTNEPQTSPGLTANEWNSIYTNTGYNPPHNGTNIYSTSQQSKIMGLPIGEKYDIEIFSPDLDGLQYKGTFINKTVDVNGELKFGLDMPFQYPNSSPNTSDRPDYAFIAYKHVDAPTRLSKLNDGKALMYLQNIEESCHPNPASDKVFLNLNVDLWSNPKIYLVDDLGRTFEREINSDNSININNFANGSYLLKIKDQAHEKSFKIIIVH